jgi:hypothetical protein
MRRAAAASSDGQARRAVLRKVLRLDLLRLVWLRLRLQQRLPLRLPAVLVAAAHGRAAGVARGPPAAEAHGFAAGVAAGVAADVAHIGAIGVLTSLNVLVDSVIIGCRLWVATFCDELAQAIDLRAGGHPSFVSWLPRGQIA